MIFLMLQHISLLINKIYRNQLIFSQFDKSIFIYFSKFCANFRHFDIKEDTFCIISDKLATFIGENKYDHYIANIFLITIHWLFTFRNGKL